KMPAFEWVHVQLHQQKGMISLSPPTICNSAVVLLSQSGASYAVPIRQPGEKWRMQGRCRKPQRSEKAHAGWTV
ncbi:hypothetical protein M2A76_27400, partial [Klebsiella pneumoniae]|nr:hypothetical protein [Klebsiella pneumoniae]